MAPFLGLRFLKNICKSNDIDMSDISGMNYKKEISKFSENIKKKFKNNYEKVFFGKLQSLTIENKLYLYSKLKTNYTINNFIMNSNFEN